ncbi:uncharacterized protein LOC126699735 [Quercus robur]|uniref:uncharacterized protein LOC126699735 n=1 Tax=Quercus robur TaxID=38942 RepID=UPI002163A25C|nr:uncharacterized protein LOC126699735 [Quercus robur]
MDDLKGRCARLSLHKKERQTIPLTPVLENNNKVLVAKLFTKRRLNVEALSRTLKSMWRFAQDFEVRDLASNTVLLLFTHEADVQKVISQGPWSFDKYLIGLYQPSAFQSVDDAKFVTSPFWIQIHNLPLSRINKVNATDIGNTIGRVVQVDASPSGECRGRCIRVRILIDIEQPLCRGRYVDLDGSDPHWISFQYERLPIFCYWCGCLNHDERDCKIWIDSGESLQKSDQQYGPWLKASLTTMQQPQLVRTKSSQPTTPPQPPRPTPSPSTQPSPPTENMPPPLPNLPTTTQNAETITQADKPETAPTHKEILSNSQLFDTFITDLDHDLNYNPLSHTPNPLPQLAHASLTDIAQHSYSTTKSTIPLNVNFDTLTTNHPDIPFPTHMSNTPKAPETITTPTDQTVTEKTVHLHGTWCQLGPPHNAVSAGISCESVLGPKWKQSH